LKEAGVSSCGGDIPPEGLAENIRVFQNGLTIWETLYGDEDIYRPFGLVSIPSQNITDRLFWANSEQSEIRTYDKFSVSYIYDALFDVLPQNKNPYMVINGGVYYGSDSEHQENWRVVMGYSSSVPAIYNGPITIVIGTTASADTPFGVPRTYFPQKEEARAHFFTKAVFLVFPNATIKDVNNQLVEYWRLSFYHKS
jgi:hypothetical protein